MNKEFCDICKKELDITLPSFRITISSHSKNFIAGIFNKGQNKNGIICYECKKELENFIAERKKIGETK